MSKATRVNIADSPPHLWDPRAETLVTYRTLLSRDATPSHGLVQGIATLHAGDVEYAHWHDVPETVHVLEGHGHARLGGEVMEMRPGDTFFVPPRCIHEWRNGEGVMRFLYTFPADSFEDIAYHLENDDTDG
ncbi:cupin domain-containing protein [Pseudooceanicola sp.]|jgi:quercetin dioxygenase-like cupin family protein|uniref:cupin domain-containing protein n=1 Tax=Pseudooceanicola sp. TaxID=1914328 RepID=UPI00405A104C